VELPILYPPIGPDAAREVIRAFRRDTTSKELQPDPVAV
jgi:hypothetical protein